MERDEFIQALEAEFPDAFSRIDESECGLLHCEVGAFRAFVETKMDDREEEYCKRAFKFIERCLTQAGPHLENAIEVSFIVDLALGEQNTLRYEIVKRSAPKIIREKMIGAHEFWK